MLVYTTVKDFMVFFFVVVAEMAESSGGTARAVSEGCLVSKLLNRYFFLYVSFRTNIYKISTSSFQLCYTSLHINQASLNHQLRSLIYDSKMS